MAVAGAPGEPSVQVALTTFKLASCAVLLVLGFALSLRYYVFNEARIGWLAMAIMLFAMSQVTESVLLLAARRRPTARSGLSTQTDHDPAGGDHPRQMSVGSADR